MKIASAEVDELARQLSRLTGEDVETAVGRALRERLSRIVPSGKPNRQTALRSFLNAVTAMNVIDAREPDEIVGYGQDGLPRS